MKKQFLLLSVIAFQVLAIAQEKPRTGGFKPSIPGSGPFYYDKSQETAAGKVSSVEKGSEVRVYKKSDVGEGKRLSKWQGHGPAISQKHDSSVTSSDRAIIREVPPYTPEEAHQSVVKSLNNVLNLNAIDDVFNRIDKVFGWLEEKQLVKGELQKTFYQIYDLIQKGNFDQVDVNALFKKFKNEISYWKSFLKNSDRIISDKNRQVINGFVLALLHFQNLISIAVLENASKSSNIDRFIKAGWLYKKFVLDANNLGVKGYVLIEPTELKNALLAIKNEKDSQLKIESLRNALAKIKGQ